MEYHYGLHVTCQLVHVSNSFQEVVGKAFWRIATVDFALLHVATAVALAELAHIVALLQSVVAGLSIVPVEVVGGILVAARIGDGASALPHAAVVKGALLPARPVGALNVTTYATAAQLSR